MLLLCFKMKSKNILASVKSKSLKEAKDEINSILEKLEKKDTNLDSTSDDYRRLIQLNKHVDYLFKKKFKEISSYKKKIKKR